MSDYRTLNRLILGKVETTPGTDAAPVPGTDAILVENPDSQANIEPLSTNEVTGGLDTKPPVPGGGGGTFAGPVNLHGSGAGGTAPEFGPFLQGAGFAETLQASDVTGTATAGAVGTITVADDSLMNIGGVITTTGGTGSGQTRVITGKASNVVSVFPNWTVTPDATTTYAYKASALYVPASSGIKHLTIYDYLHSSTSGVDSRLRALLGAQGNVSFTLPNRGIAQANFNFQGKFVQPTDVTHPGSGTFDSQRPVTFQNADINLDQNSTPLNTLSFDMGNELAFADDPTDQFGVDVAQITRRRITGRINPRINLLTIRNVWTDFLAGTTRKFWTRYGAVGNGISVYFPEMLYTGEEVEDINGLAHQGIPFGAEGEDTGVYICIY